MRLAILAQLSGLAAQARAAAPHQLLATVLADGELPDALTLRHTLAAQP